MTPTPKRRWFRWSLGTMLTMLTLAACWLGYEARWIANRHAFLATQDNRTVAEQFPLSQARAPFPLWLMGERGIADFPVIVNRKPGSVPLFLPDAEYPEVQDAQRLFPEARITAVVSIGDGSNEIKVPRPSPRNPRLP